MNHNAKIILLDKQSCAQDEPGLIIHWASRDVFPPQLSLANLVEEKAEQIRCEYMDWCYELGESVENNKKLADYFKIGTYPSFWFMSSLKEKNILKSPNIFLIFKLRALELYVIEHSTRFLELRSNDPELELIVAKFCTDLNINYIGRIGSNKPRKSWDLSVIFGRYFPYSLQASLIWLRSMMRYAVYFRHRSSISTLKRQATVVSYFPNLDRKLAEKGLYKSFYWNEAQDFLQERSPCNWVWLYAANQHYSLKESLELKNKFSVTACANQKYFFIDEFLSFSLFWKALFLYFKLYAKSKAKKTIAQQFKLPGSKFNFWSILKKDWYSSFQGKVAMQNCLWVFGFEQLAKILPEQQLCLYLWENQGWEKALISSWRKSQSGPVYGFQHSSLVYFDMRNYINPRKLESDYAKTAIPDLILSSGQRASLLLIENNFPLERIKPVEAVRFSYLNGFSCNQKEKFAQKTLLVLTGYFPTFVMQQLKLLNDVIDDNFYSYYDKVIIKAHPFQSIDSFLPVFKNLSGCELSNDALGPLLAEVDFVYSDNHTTASVEAIMARKPVAIHVPQDFFNLSPLYHPGLVQNKGINFASTVAQLSNALFNGLALSSIESDYFFLDPNFPRWRGLLNEVFHEAT